MGAGQGGVQVGCPICDLMGQQPTPSSHRTRPSLPPSVHSGRPSLTTPGPFRDRCPASLPPSLCSPFRGALSLGFPPLLCPGHAAPLPSPARWVTSSLLGPGAGRRALCCTLRPGGWGRARTLSQQSCTWLLALHRPGSRQSCTSLLALHRPGSQQSCTWLLALHRPGSF